MGCCSCLTTIGYLGIVPLVIYVIKTFYDNWKRGQMEKMLDQFSQEKTGKDVLIVHSMRRGKTVPSVSPYALKLETYLRMCGIKYEMEFDNPYGPKGKFPWISLNGEHVSDSQLIIEFIAKKFEKNLAPNVDEKSRSIAMLRRVVLEEYFFWGMATERFMFGRRHQFDYSKLVKVPSALVFLVKMFVNFEMTRRSKVQGIGLHSESEIVHLMKKNLRAISNVLANQKYICGDTPCEEDAGLFGILAQVVFSLPNSPYERFVKDELKNLEEYCNRMKTQFWPDWDQLVGH